MYRNNLPGFPLWTEKKIRYRGRTEEQEGNVDLGGAQSDIEMDDTRLQSSTELHRLSDPSISPLDTQSLHRILVGELDFAAFKCARFPQIPNAVWKEVIDSTQHILTEDAILRDRLLPVAIQEAERKVALVQDLGKVPIFKSAIFGRYFYKT